MIIKHIDYFWRIFNILFGKVDMKLLYAIWSQLRVHTYTKRNMYVYIFVYMNVHICIYINLDVNIGIDEKTLV